MKIGKVKFLKGKKRKGKPALLTRTCPPGLALAGPDMTEVRVLVQFRTFLFLIEDGSLLSGLSASSFDMLRKFDPTFLLCF